MTMVAGGGDNWHQRTGHHAACGFCEYKEPGYQNAGVRRSICKDSYELTSAKANGYIFSYSSAKFRVERRARSAPPQGMKAFASGDKIGTPAKKRSRSISTRKREVGQRISVLSTNTYLRTLSIAVALSKIGEKRNCHRPLTRFPQVPAPTDNPYVLLYSFRYQLSVTEVPGPNTYFK